MAKPECRNVLDHLYTAFCNNLRELGKVSSFCQLIKNANSDLNRIAALSKVCNIVLLIKSVKKCMRNNAKNAQRADGLLDMYYAKKDVTSESVTDLIVLLNSALADVPIENELNFEEFEDFGSDEIRFIENLLVSSVETSLEESLLSDIHGERAAYFYNVAEYEVCLLEALRGIFYAKISRDNPSDSLFPLLYLVSSSLRQLNQFKMASNVLQLSIKLLRISALDNTAKSLETVKLVKLMKEIQIASKDGVGTADKSLNLKPFLEPENENIPTVGETSDVLVSASKSLALKWQADRGRHVVALETIPLGSTIITERPFSSVIHPKNSFSFCQNCCHEVKSLVTCKECSSVVFCSTKCRSACQEFHKYECKYMKTLRSSEILGDMGLLCYRTVCKTDLRVLESHVREHLTFHETDIAGVQDNEVVSPLRNKLILGLDKSGKLDSKNYTSVFVQTPNSDARLGGDLLKRCFSAIFLTICLRFAGYFEHTDVNDIENGKLNKIEQQVASLVLRHLQSTSCNAYGINTIDGSDPCRIQVNEIGSAIYPTISATNHSCNSNIYRFTMGNACIVKTLSEIKAGDEILDSYGPHFASNSIEDRNRYLDGQYLFSCRCQPCAENWLAYSKLPKDNLSFKCPQCGSESSACGKGKHFCPKCSNTFDTRKTVKMTKELEKNFQEAKLRLLSSNKMSVDYKDAESSIVRYANALEKIQKWPSQTLIECQEALKLCWNLEHQI